MGGDRQLHFQVEPEGDGVYSAQCVGFDIFTEGDSFDELLTNIREVVEAYFFDQPGEYTLQVHFKSEPIFVPA